MKHRITSSLLILCTGVGTLFAQPGNGIRLGQQLVLTPELTGSYNYNDNVNLRRRALDEGGEVLDENESDSFLSSGASLLGRYWNDSTQWNGNAWLNNRTYDKNSNLDSDTYGGSVGFFWTRPQAKTTFKSDVSYQNAIDRTEISRDFVGDSDLTPELENVAERVKREEVRTNFTLSQRITEPLRATINYGFVDIAYDNERYSDRTSYQYAGELSYQVSERTQAYGKAGLGIDDDEGLEDDAEKPYYLVGVRYSPTPKLDIDASIGQETFKRTPIGEEELEDTTTKWAASLTWAASAKSRIMLNGRTGFGSVASPGSSSREEISASLAWQHQTTRQISQRLSVAWREDDYLTPLPARGSEYDELKETLWYQYRIDYQTPRPWLSLFGQASFEDGSSRIPGDSYTETQFTVGLSARY